MFKQKCANTRYCYAVRSLLNFFNFVLRKEETNSYTLVKDFRSYDIFKTISNDRWRRGVPLSRLCYDAWDHVFFFGVNWKKFWRKRSWPNGTFADARKTWTRQGFAPSSSRKQAVGVTSLIPDASAAADMSEAPSQRSDGVVSRIWG
jgi:hypothetical protein